MGRTAKKRDLPHPKPVQKVELSEKNIHWRVVLIVLFLAIAMVAFGYAVSSYFSADSGWREIQVESTAKTNCGNEFIFQYYLGDSGISATAENKALITLYTEAAINAYQLFNSDEDFEGVNNLHYLSRHPNETVEVDKVLYEAFALLEEYGNRSLYLAPVYAEYNNLFYCNDDSQTVNFDPYQNGEVLEYFSEILAFANDPEAVNIELLGNNQVRLTVSDAYLEYAAEMGIDSFIDFFWMKNAFVADYLADVMIERGYTKGAISSFDGFVRNLDESGRSYSFNLFDRDGQIVYPAAVMEYTGSISLVYLRNYPVGSLDSQHYYELANGEIRTSYIDTADGLCKSALNNLVSYSKTAGCAEVLLQVLPVYIADSFSPEELAMAKDAGIYSIYCADNVIYYNESELTLKDLFEEERVRYTTSFVQ